MFGTYQNDFVVHLSPRIRTPNEAELKATILPSHTSVGIKPVVVVNVCLLLVAIMLPAVTCRMFPPNGCSGKLNSLFTPIFTLHVVVVGVVVTAVVIIVFTEKRLLIEENLHRTRFDRTS